jgi:hypothetical protein
MAGMIVAQEFMIFLCLATALFILGARQISHQLPVVCTPKPHLQIYKSIYHYILASMGIYS